MKHYKTPDSIPAPKHITNGIEDICFTEEYRENCLNDYFISVPHHRCVSNGIMLNVECCCFIFYH